MVSHASNVSHSQSTLLGCLDQREYSSGPTLAMLVKSKTGDPWLWWTLNSVDFKENHIVNADCYGNRIWHLFLTIFETSLCNVFLKTQVQTYFMDKMTSGDISTSKIVTYMMWCLNPLGIINLLARVSGEMSSIVWFLSNSYIVWDDLQSFK